MYNLENVLLGLLVVDALALIVLVLIQQGKGADVGAAFGSGGSNTMFGSAGSGSFLSRTTTWLSIGFFLISFGLAYTAKQRAAEVSTLGIPQVSAPEAEREPSALDQGVNAVELEMTKQEATSDSVVPDLPSGSELQDSLDSVESNLEDGLESGALSAEEPGEAVIPDL